MSIRVSDKKKDTDKIQSDVLDVASVTRTGTGLDCTVAGGTRQKNMKSGLVFTALPERRDLQESSGTKM